MNCVPKGYSADLEPSVENSRFVELALEAMLANIGPTPPVVFGVVGFAGPAGVGKDTAVVMLEKYLRAHRFGVCRDSVAEPLYALVSTLTGIPVHVLRDRRYKEAPLTWEGAPKGLEAWTPRKLLQWMGTDVVRKQLDQEFWIRRFRERTGSRKDSVVTLVSDIRYSNEAQACDLVVELSREGAQYTGDHTSAVRLSDECIHHVAKINSDTSYAVFGFGIMQRLADRKSTIQVIS